MAAVKTTVLVFTVACVVIVAIVILGLNSVANPLSKTLRNEYKMVGHYTANSNINNSTKVTLGPTAARTIRVTEPTAARMIPVTEPTVAKVGPAPTASTATARPSNMNPGCIERKVGKYKPVDVGSEVAYHHPSLIQYAKLSKSATTTSVSLTFMEYVALLSAYKFLKPEQIMIHTYTNIIGKYWDIVQKWNTSVVINKVERVVKLGKRTVPSSLITHHADFIKIRGLLEFGGTISDFDVIIVNGTRWKKMQKMAECVLSQQVSIINAGFNSCIVNSSFVRRWLNGYYTDYRTDWLHNASYLPKSILESKKSTCYNMYVVDGIATQPMWSKYQEWLKADGVQWRKKVAAHYFNKDMKAYDESSIHANNSFGELLRYVLDA